jgi:hypothetical protein
MFEVVRGGGQRREVSSRQAQCCGQDRHHSGTRGATDCLLGALDQTLTGSAGGVECHIAVFTGSSDRETNVFHRTVAGA